jgi:hypothetical protein
MKPLAFAICRPRTLSSTWDDQRAVALHWSLHPRFAPRRFRHVIALIEADLGRRTSPP